MKHLKTYENFDFQRGETRYLIVTEDGDQYLSHNFFNYESHKEHLSSRLNNIILPYVEELTMGHDPNSLKRNTLIDEIKAQKIVELINNDDIDRLPKLKVEAIFIGAYSIGKGLNI